MSCLGGIREERKEEWIIGGWREVEGRYVGPKKVRGWAAVALLTSSE